MFFRFLHKRTLGGLLVRRVPFGLLGLRKQILPHGHQRIDLRVDLLVREAFQVDRVGEAGRRTRPASRAERRVDLCDALDQISLSVANVLLGDRREGADLHAVPAGDAGVLVHLGDHRLPQHLVPGEEN